MDTPQDFDKGYTEEENKRAQGHKWMRRLGPPALIYGIMSASCGLMLLAGGPQEFEYHQATRQVQQKEPLTIKGFDLIEFFRAPFDLAGLPGFDELYEARNLTYEAYDIDPTDPRDDFKRFDLYRNMGYAVPENGRISIRFEDWCAALEKKDALPEQLARYSTTITKYSTIIHSVTHPFDTILMGNVFHNFDSARNCGNEDGVLQPSELDEMYRAMGYIPDSDAREVKEREISAIIEGAESTEAAAADIVTLLNVKETVPTQTTQMNGIPYEIPYEKWEEVFKY